MAEKMKKGPSEAGRKTLKCPHKQGINLNMREQKGNPRLTLLVGCLAIVILAGCVAKFGVIDQYRRLDAAQAAYASVHTEYTQMQELLKGYDRLLMEYRTYSMEWATDGSEDNGTLVDRQKALDLLEQEMLSRGRLVSLQVSGNKMVVAMSGMSLDQISRMFDVIQQSPIVSNVELNLASTEDGNVSTILDFTVRITLRSRGGRQMNRELTRREKILLLVLIVVVLVAGYCKLILIPINDQISSYRLNMEAEQTELDANQGKMAQMQKMQKAIEEIKAAGEKRTIPQYDNSGKLMIELHEIMSDTLDYSLDCSAGTVQQDYIMLRPIVMTFRTSTYAQARQIVDRLCSSENISQISDMNMNTYTEGRNSGTVETTLVITYFEIMP